jgi:hypothetical protein
MANNSDQPGRLKTLLIFDTDGATVDFVIAKVFSLYGFRLDDDKNYFLGGRQENSTLSFTLRHEFLIISHFPPR